MSGPGPNALTGKNEGGFRNDAALFVVGEPFEGVGGVMEIHFVGDASDPVITEAKMTWDVLSADDGDLTLRFAGGRFWWPFGIHNGEWFSAINNFSLLSPTATEVVPAHYNEVGVMAEGELKVNDGLGLNYVAAIGNGVPGFGLMDNVRGTGADTNSNRTITGRVGLLLRSAGDIEVGVSAASGELRSVADPDPDLVGSAEAYEGEFSAFGPDLTLSWQALSLRYYYYSSSEDLKGVAAGENDSISRSGYTFEPIYTLTSERERFSSVSLMLRYSMAEEENLQGQTLTRSQLGIGVKTKITAQFVGRAAYMVQGEDDALPDMDNNAFTISFTNEF